MCGVRCRERAASAQTSLLSSALCTPSLCTSNDPRHAVHLFPHPRQHCSRRRLRCASRGEQAGLHAAPHHHLGAHRDRSGDQHLHWDARRADLDDGRALRVGDNVPHHLDGHPDEDAVQACRHQRPCASSRARLRAVMRCLDQTARSFTIL